MNKSLYLIGALALVGFAILGKSMMNKSRHEMGTAAKVVKAVESKEDSKAEPVVASPEKTNPAATAEKSIESSQVLAGLNKELTTCNSEIQEITIKYKELEAMVDALIKKEEERVLNWQQSQEIAAALKDENKKGNENFTKKMQALLADHEKKLTAIKNGYMKACPCAVN